MAHVLSGVASEPSHSSILEMVSAYIKAIRSVQPQGPYRLLGWSLGGVIAFEMASQLNTLGQVVSNLFLLDAVLPIKHRPQ